MAESGANTARGPETPLRAAWLGRIGYDAGVDLQQPDPAVHPGRRLRRGGHVAPARAPADLHGGPQLRPGRRAGGAGVAGAARNRRRRVRPGRARHLPRSGPARGLPGHRPAARPPQRSRLRPRSAGGPGSHAGGVRRRGSGRRRAGAHRRLGRAAEDRLDRHPPPPLGDDPRIRSERHDRPSTTSPASSPAASTPA